jgi:hypothetical protein
MPPESPMLEGPEPEYARLHYLDVDVQDGKGWTTRRGLVDGGSQGNCIQKELSRIVQTNHTLKTSPITMIMADGNKSPAGPITHHDLTTVRIAGNEEQLALDVTALSHPLLIGMPWLRKHNPLIDYHLDTMTFHSEYCRQNCKHFGETVTLFPSDQRALSPDLETTPATITATTPGAIPESIPHAEITGETLDGVLEQPIDAAPMPPEHPPSDPSGRSATRAKISPPKRRSGSRSGRKAPRAKRPPKSPPISVDATPSGFKTKMAPKVALIGAAAFARVCTQQGTELFFLSIEELLGTQLAHQEADPAVPSPEFDLATIPPEYHEFADLFSKKESDKLPPHRSYDHQIPLEPGSTPPFGTIYKMSPVELEAARKYIEENLRKGFIRNSQSPCSAPIVFARKSDGSLRLCVDYRGLNKLTIKNRYPLPLIGELLERMNNAKYFTKFDVRDGYNRLRMAPGEEWKTAFRCRYGLFEYTVMPFGLCNAPGTFQHYMNDTFREFLDIFLVVYLDDLLIYSPDLKTHKKHVRMVLERLQEAGLFLKPSKCQFHVQEVEFLGFVISGEGVKMDPAKVDAVTSWPAPKSPHDVRMFLGLANFYRRFIRAFSKLATPLTRLLKKENLARRFTWDRKAQEAFDGLREAFTTAPVLQHFDETKPVVLEADASDLALGAVISQYGDDGLLHPVAFHSRKFGPAELNYEIYDKELLAIVDSLEQYRHMFEGLGHQIAIYSDHHNLLWFTETKVYNRRQARWAEKLSKYDFVIHFRPGTQGGKPDALSRRPDYVSENSVREPSPVLKPSQFTSSEVKVTAPGESLGNADLRQSILEAIPKDPVANAHRNSRPDGFSVEEGGLLLKEGRVYVPEDNGVKLRILEECHDGKAAGHLGQEKTLERVERDYVWPGMRKFVNKYVLTCDTCARNKTPRHRRRAQLQPLPIPGGAWQSVSMDYIVELPPSHGYNAIYACVDRLTKMAHFTATNSNVTAEETADLYLRNVFKNHGLPRDIVSDRGTQFVSKFTRRLLELLDVKGNRSTAYHPESDGQTERVNQTLEQYLRIYCDFQQDDWYQLLPLAEFVYNNAKSASTGMSPFFANYGFHPRAAPKVRTEPASYEHPAAETLADHLRNVHAELRVELEKAQQAYKRKFDRKAKPVPSFKVGDLVWLNRKNIETTRPSAKLDFKRFGPFKITKVVGEARLAFELELPPQWRIHNVFHATLLDPYHANEIEGRTQLVPQMPEIVEGEPEYEVKEVLDSKIVGRKVWYHVDWVGYGPEGRTWEPVENLAHSEKLVTAYHRRHPNRPSQADVPTHQPRRSSVRKGGVLSRTP